MSTGIAIKRPLSPLESARLAELEPIIQRGMTNFVEVGTALLEISDRRLYRETHSTFQEYVADKWKMTARRAYQLCEAAEVVKALPENVNHGTHLNERQVRELVKVPESDRPEVLKVAASKGPVTAKAIRLAANLEPDDKPVVVAHTEVLEQAVYETDGDRATYAVEGVLAHLQMANEEFGKVEKADGMALQAKAVELLDAIEYQSTNIANRLARVRAWMKEAA